MPLILTPCSRPSRRGLSRTEAVVTFERRPSLTAAVRGVLVTAGRDEETVPRSNKETVQAGGAAAGASACQGVPLATTALMKMSSFLAQAISARLWPLPAAVSRL